MTILFKLLPCPTTPKKTGIGTMSDMSVDLSTLRLDEQHEDMSPKGGFSSPNPTRRRGLTEPSPQRRLGSKGLTPISPKRSSKPAGAGSTATVQAHREYSLAVKAPRDLFTLEEELATHKSLPPSPFVVALHPESTSDQMATQFGRPLNQVIPHIKTILLKYTESSDPKKLKIAEAFYLQLWLHIVSGLADIHKTGIAHRDVKPENLVIEGRRTIQHADFGSAKKLGEPATLFGRSFLYTHPELLDPDATVTKESDCFSSGVVLMHLLFDTPYMFNQRIYEYLDKKFTSELIRSICDCEGQHLENEALQKILQDTHIREAIQNIQTGKPHSQDIQLYINEAVANNLSCLPETVRTAYFNLIELSKIPAETWTIETVRCGQQGDVMSASESYQAVKAHEHLPMILGHLGVLPHLLSSVLGPLSSCPSSDHLQKNIEDRLKALEAENPKLPEDLRKIWDSINTAHYELHGITYDPADPNAALDSLRLALVDGKD